MSFGYILSGELRAYADGNVFSLTAGECIFLPRRKPHAWLITSDEAKLILVVTPGGSLNALNKLSAQAGRRLFFPERPQNAEVAYVNETVDIPSMQWFGEFR